MTELSRSRYGTPGEYDWLLNLTFNKTDGNIPVDKRQKCDVKNCPIHPKEVTGIEDEMLSKLDPEIAPVVIALRRHSIETFESCQGGDGHCSPEPFVRFSGEQNAGFLALGVALNLRMPVYQLQRVWSVQDGEPTGPDWKLIFVKSKLPQWNETFEWQEKFFGRKS